MFPVGIGSCFANPTGGNASTPSGPVFFGSLQDISFDFTQKIIKLMGQGKFADAAAQGDMDLKGKAAIGRFETSTFNHLMFGETTTANVKLIDSLETHTIPTTPFAVTVTNSATWNLDLGVMNAITGAPYVAVGMTPVAGVSYTVASGVYTFASADAGTSVTISYTNVPASPEGSTLQIIQHPIAYGPFWEFYMPIPTPQTFPSVDGIHLFRCFSSAFKMPMKRDGFTISDFEWECFPDPTRSNAVAEFYQVSA